MDFTNQFGVPGQTWGGGNFGAPVRPGVSAAPAASAPTLSVDPGAWLASTQAAQTAQMNANIEQLASNRSARTAPPAYAQSPSDYTSPNYASALAQLGSGVNQTTLPGGRVVNNSVNPTAATQYPGGRTGMSQSAQQDWIRRAAAANGFSDPLGQNFNWAGNASNPLWNDWMSGTVPGTPFYNGNPENQGISWGPSGTRVAPTIRYLTDSPRRSEALVPGGLTRAQAARQPTSSAPQYAPENSGAPGSMAGSDRPAQNSPEWLALGDMLRDKFATQKAIQRGQVAPSSNPDAMWNGHNLSAMTRSEAVRLGALGPYEDYWLGTNWQDDYNPAGGTNSLFSIGYQV